MDPVLALHRLGGVAAYRDLRRLGVSRPALDRAVRGGRIDHAARGWYCLADLDPQLLVAARCGGVVSCATAASVHGLAVLFAPARPHVTVPARRRQHLPGARTHRRDLAPHERNGLVTSLLRTVLDCARCLPFPEAVVVADAALRAGLLVADLTTAAAATQGRGSGRVRQVATAADPSAESPIETLARLLFVAAGLSFRTQVPIPGIGRVDFLLEGFLVVEVDGFAYHADRASYRNDRRRTNALTAAGYVVLRFSYEDLVHHPDRVLAAIRAVLGARAA